MQTVDFYPPCDVYTVFCFFFLKSRLQDVYVLTFSQTNIVIVSLRSRDRSKAMTPSGDYSHPLRRRGHKSRLLQFNSNSGLVSFSFIIIFSLRKIESMQRILSLSERQY